MDQDSGGLRVADRAWLSAVSRPGGVGFEATGWPASAWLLHAMFEVPAADGRTHDDVHRAELVAGLSERTIISAVDLDSVGVVSGVPLGMTEPPLAPWVRLRWRELAERLGIDMTTKVGYPTPSWFGYQSWPASIEPPCEGSLDRITLDALVSCLARHSSSGLTTTCRSFHQPSEWFDQVSVIDSPLGELPLFGTDPPFTASNIWPLDRHWFVYTDYDLGATKVSGSLDLIADLHAAPDLEVIILEPGPPPDTSREQPLVDHMRRDLREPGYPDD